MKNEKSEVQDKFYDFVAIIDIILSTAPDPTLISDRLIKLVRSETDKAVPKEWKIIQSIKNKDIIKLLGIGKFDSNIKSKRTFLRSCMGGGLAGDQYCKPLTMEVKNLIWPFNLCSGEVQEEAIEIANEYVDATNARVKLWHELKQDFSTVETIPEFREEFPEFDEYMDIFELRIKDDKEEEKVRIEQLEEKIVREALEEQAHRVSLLDAVNGKQGSNICQPH